MFTFASVLYERAVETGETVFVILMIAAFAAGFVDSIAGGGGLITIPALLLSGMPPLLALGTNKLQGMFGSGSAAYAYARGGHVKTRDLLPMAAMSCAGAIAGAVVALLLPTEFLRYFIPVALLAIAAYFWFRPDLSDIDTKPRLSLAALGFSIVPLIGFYDGLFGPGTGSFFMIAFVALAGHGVLKATAHTKLLNFASNLGGFAIFALGGAIAWKIGLAMGLAQVAGAFIGSRLAMRRGAKLIRPLLILVCVAMALRLLWQ